MAKSARKKSPGRPVGSRTKNPGSSRFKSALELGFPINLVRAISSAVDKFGKSAKLRFVTFAAPGEPLNRSEERIPVELIRAAREVAQKLGANTVYFPRSFRSPAVLVDKEGAQWLRAEGYSVRTIMDVYAVSTALVYSAIGDTPAVDGPRKKADDPEDYKVGLEWMLGGSVQGRRLGDKAMDPLTLNSKVGPARIARCGEAIRDFRKHFGRDPVRVA